MMKHIMILIFTTFLSGHMVAQETYEALLASKAHLENRKASLAISILNDALAKQRDGRLYLVRAEAYISEGRLPDAINDCDQANALIPSGGEYCLARIFALKRDPDAALVHLEKSLNSQFRRSEREIFLDPAFSYIENTPQWRLFWKSDRYNAKEEALEEIRYTLSKSRNEEAVQLLKELSGNYPESRETLYAGALVNSKLKKYPEAVNSLSSLLASDKNNAEYLSALAEVQEASGNPSGAATTYSRLIGLEYQEARLFLARAECYRKILEFGKAKADAEKYLQWYPESMEAIRLSGRIYYEAGDNLKALEYFSRNVSLHPDDPQCFIDRADSYFISKTWENAISDYSMALDLSPGNQDAWLNKGISLLNKGRTEEACHDFAKARAGGNSKAAGYISRYCIK